VTLSANPLAQGSPIMVVTTGDQDSPRGGDLSLRALLSGAPRSVPVLGVGTGGLSTPPQRLRSVQFSVWVATASAHIRRQLHRNRAQVIHCNDVRAFIAGTVAAAGTNVKVSFHLRDVVPKRPLWRLVFHHASMIVVISEMLRDQVCSFGVPHDKVLVIHNPVSRQCQGLRYQPRNTNQLFFPAAIEPRKGQLEFVEQIGRVVAATGYDVMFAGRIIDGAYWREVCRAAAVAGLNVDYAGYQHDYLQRMAMSRGVIIFSQREGLSRVAVEACAIGAPVLARYLPVLEEVTGSALGQYSLLQGRDQWYKALTNLDSPDWAVLRNQRARLLQRQWTPERAWERFEQTMLPQHAPHTQS
jgi:glycosyltransferase involved in cell wall biosynthesis